jgi:hypothetical protein
MLIYLARLEDWQLEDIGWSRERLARELAEAGIVRDAPDTRPPR